MPIYEFRCTECKAEFEQLCKIKWQDTVTCPLCSSNNIQKVLSVFSGAGRSGGSGCSSCSGKSCSSCK